MNMKDKVFICTGVSAGIGYATALDLINDGAKLLGTDISPCPSELTVNENFTFLQIDITEAGAPEKIVEASQKAFGEKIDCLLNVSGIMDNFSSADTLDDETWDRVLAVNLTAPVKLMRAVVRVMLKQYTGGNIVNVSSKAGMSGATAGLSYASSKHGLIGATQNVAWRYRHNRIRCNVICPGVVANTNIAKPTPPSEWDVNAYKQAQVAFSPITRDDYLQPAAIASLIIYLASDASMGMNGSIVPIDNAWSTV